MMDKNQIRKNLSDEELIEIINKAIKKFAGPLDRLELAIGYLLCGRRFGWRVMYLMHRQSTVKKYESILGVNSKEVMPEEGDLVKKSVVYDTLKTVSNYWKAVKGEVPGARSSEIK